MKRRLQWPSSRSKTTIKAPEVDGITAKLLKLGGAVMIQWLTQINKKKLGSSNTYLPMLCGSIFVELLTHILVALHHETRVAVRAYGEVSE